MTHLARLRGLLLCTFAMPGAVYGQAAVPPVAFDAFPGGIASQYQFNFARNFFVTRDEETRARAALVKDAQLFGAKRDSISKVVRTSPVALERALETADSLRRRAGKHFAYLSLLGYVDTREVAASTASQDLGAVMQRELAFVWDEASRIPSATLESWIAVHPSLGRWKFFMEQMRNQANRRVSAEQLAAANAQAGVLYGWQPSAFQGLLRVIDFGKVNTPEGLLDVRTDAGTLMNHVNRTVRAQWYVQNRAGLASARDSFAVMLSTTVRGRNDVARARGFADHREESYGQRFLAVADVRGMLERIAQLSDINKRYERARIEHLRRTFGFDTVHSWDLVLPEPGMTVPRFTITEASRTLIEALSPIGQAYTMELKALLDPSNGRLDLVPRPNRSERQGFSTGNVGYPSTFFQGRFAGFLDDVITFGHEAGHSVQNMLMEAQHVRVANAGGPEYFTESFAGLNELLIADYLFRTANDRAHKIYYLQRFLDQSTEVIARGREAMLEDELYRTLNVAHVGSASEFEAMEQRIGQRYSLWYGANSERTMEWVNAVHYYTRPLYRVNYLYSKLLALVYFDRLTRNPSQFAKQYNDLLANGYDAGPDALLKRYLGLSLTDPRLVNEAMTVVEGRLSMLEAMYKTQ